MKALKEADKNGTVVAPDTKAEEKVIELLFDTEQSVLHSDKP